MPALFRTFAALGLLAIPTFEERFSALGLPLTCGGLAVAAILVAAMLRSSPGGHDWSVPVVDAVSLAIVVPTAIVASRVAVADARLGGGPEYFAAAAAAVVGATAIIALMAALLSGGSPGLATIGLLPAPLMVASVVAGAGRFDAVSLGQGLAMAWFVAALITIVDGIAADRGSAMLAPIGFSLFAVAVIVFDQSDSTSPVTATNSALALVATALVGALLLVVPNLAAGGPGTSPTRRNHA